VPGLLRARRRQRPGLAAHPGGPRRRRLRGHRLEDLDLPRRGGRLLRAAGPHRADDSRHRGISWLILPMDSPGGRDPPAHHHRRVHRVRRALPRRGAGAGGQPGGRGERRLAGDHGDPELRAGHRLRRRPARGHRAAGERSPARGPGLLVGPRPSAGRPATSVPSSTPCGRSPSATSPRPPGPVSPASAAPSSSWPTPRRGRSSASSPWRCSTGPGSAADDARGARRRGPAAGRDHGGGLASRDLPDHRRGHLADPAEHRGRADPRPAPVRRCARAGPADGLPGHGLRADRVPPSWPRACGAWWPGGSRSSTARRTTARRSRPAGVAALGETGVFNPACARGRGHRPGPGRGRPGLRGARPGTRARPVGGASHPPPG
jgi:hypothetical protein